MAYFTTATIPQVMGMDKVVIQVSPLDTQHKLAMALKLVTHRLNPAMVNNNKLTVMIQQVVISNVVILITICNCNYRWCIW